MAKKKKRKSRPKPIAQPSALSSPRTRTFKSVGYWTYKGHRYTPNEPVSMSVEEARKWLERGTIVPVAEVKSESAVAKPASEVRSVPTTSDDADDDFDVNDDDEDNDDDE